MRFFNSTKTITFKSDFNKDKNNYSYDMFLEKSPYAWPKI